MTRVALCFPGQGSQHAGMADGLLDSPAAQDLLDAAGAEGVDLGAALQGDDEALRPTEIAQPAIVFTELALAALLPADLDVVGVAGHSVGEYAALAACSAASRADALRLVIRRGRAMAQMREGTMAAVIGLDGDAVDEACAATGETVVVANHNAPGQVVISGTRSGVERAAELCRERGAKRVLPLNVSGAFHSPLMSDAARLFAAELDSVALQPAQPPLLCNVDATPHRDPGEIREQLGRQLESPVRWSECVQQLVGLGAEVLIEVGPGKVLTGLARRIAPEVRTLSVATAESAAGIGGQLEVPA